MSDLGAICKEFNAFYLESVRCVGCLKAECQERSVVAIINCPMELENHYYEKTLMRQCQDKITTDTLYENLLVVLEDDVCGKLFL